MNKILDLRKTKLSAAKRFFKASPVVMIMAGLVVAGVASAAIVSYLANDVVLEGKVSSPVKMSINPGVDCAEGGPAYLNFSPAFGSDPITYTIVSRNQSGGDVTGYNVTVNKQTDGGNLTGREFTEVETTDWATGTPVGPFYILDDTYVVCLDGTLKPLVDPTYIWDSPKLVTTVCHAAYNGTGKCTIANEDAMQGIIAGGDKECISTKLTLNQATVGTYQFRGQFADDLAKFAAERYGTAPDPCSETIAI